MTERYCEGHRLRLLAHRRLVHRFENLFAQFFIFDFGERFFLLGLQDDFPHKNKKGRKKENSSGRAAPQGSPALPARLCVGRR